MSQTCTCADNLRLLGEMVQMASDYINLYRETLGQEERAMIKLAYGQISPLRNEVAKLDKELSALQIQLRPHVKREDSGSRPRAEGASG
jgi:hypothetical protein